jgi:CspA family cold shock protein
MPESDRVTGTVKWFNPGRGYGFIKPDDGPDVYVHHTAVQGEGDRPLTEGDRVEFAIADDPKGPKAIDVVRLAS